MGGFDNLIGIGPVKAAHYVEKRASEEGLTDADRAKLAKHHSKHEDLSPAHTLWGHIYEDPDCMNIHGQVKQLAEMDDRENVCIIGRVSGMDRRDKNEPSQVARRGYVMRGQTQYLDLWLVDDSVTDPVRCRVGHKDWDWIGEQIADGADVGNDWVLIRGKWMAKYSMLSIDKIKGLTNAELIK